MNVSSSTLQYQRTAIMEAGWAGSGQVIKALADKGANVNSLGAVSIIFFDFWGLG